MRSWFVLFLTIAYGLPSVTLAESTTPPRSVVAMGNSITRMGPAPSLKWSGDWGLAASSAERDYAGRFTALLNSTHPPQLKRIHLAGLERNPKAFKIDADVTTSGRTSDVLVIELGDNVSTETLPDFEPAYKNLLAKARPAKGVLLCLSTWWHSVKVDAIIKPACTQAGGTFVDLSDLPSNPDFYADKTQFQDEGVRSHPGDKGMEEIAQQLLKAYLKKTQ